MAVLLGTLLVLGQVIGLDDGMGNVFTSGPSDDATVETDVETPPEVEATPAPAAVAPVRSVWLRLAECESTSRWHVATGNGYYGGLQMDMVFWRRYGGLQYASRPDYASMEQQVAVAERGLAVQGFGAWPVCSRRLGLR